MKSFKEFAEQETPVTNIYITIAIPLAGKSTWTNKFIAENPDTVIICPDDIRKEITGSITDQTQNGKVFELAYNRFNKAIHDKVPNIIFDGTNINPRTRDQILSYKTPWTKFHYVVFPVSLQTALERKKKDADRIAKGERSDVPDDVIERFYNQFNQEFSNIAKDDRVESVKVIE